MNLRTKSQIINQLEPGRPLEVKFFSPSTSILLFGLRPESFLWWDLVTSEPFIPITKTLKASAKIERLLRGAPLL